MIFALDFWISSLIPGTMRLAIILVKRSPGLIKI
jgi:hypothetical protein